MYSRITSSVTLPERATKYPRAQIGRPQKVFWMCLNSIASLRLVLPLMYYISLLGAKCGGTDTNRCT